MKKKVFANGFSSYKSIYVYIVGGFSILGDCDRYEWRLCVCASLEEAINFVNEKFFQLGNKVKDSDFYREGLGDINTFILNKEVEKI